MTKYRTKEACPSLYCLFKGKLFNQQDLERICAECINSGFRGNTSFPVRKIQTPLGQHTGLEM